MAVERLDQRFGLGARNLEGVGHPETVAAHPQVHGIGAHPVVPFGSSAVRQERIRGDRPVALLRYAEALEQPGFGRNERDPLAASSRDQRLRGRKAVRRKSLGREEIGNDTASGSRSEEHTSELQSLAYLVCRLLLEKKKKIKNT